MEIKWLKTFLVAAQFENFRKASEKLFLTQPAVSKHIRQLEKNLNIPLFKREGKAVSLTAAGLKFLPIAREWMAIFEQRMDEFESWKQGYHRKLTITVAPQIASSFLPAILRTFMGQHPDIEVMINIMKSYDIGGEISTGRADLGLTRIQPVQANIQTELIHEERVMLVGSPFMHRNGSIDEEIVLTTYRLMTDNHPDYWNDLLPRIKSFYPAVQTMPVNQVEGTKRFIEEGLGVSYLPISMVKEEIESGKLIEIPSIYIQPPISKTFLIVKVATEEAQLFSRFLKEAIASQ
ncbi:LysR family transcriptional regulator [Lederbergia sp. NSJ-179]|uniref:LysR family transcriptional regulator n=1 Tax=Lederbergia sp. NSJ-179 TaxID=2931402 RepID=UPI001FD06A50|nr:LysR family transcriptional regulator [Lederbergia sp. NSJ-179]MCJ7840026.1 LysR family transcriptional regulator [Lederbergia sp. NSJ-179]